MINMMRNIQQKAQNNQVILHSKFKYLIKDIPSNDEQPK